MRILYSSLTAICTKIKFQLQPFQTFNCLQVGLGGYTPGLKQVERWVVVVRTSCVSERKLYSMRSVVLSRHDRHDFGALAALARASAPTVAKTVAEYSIGFSS